MDRKTLLILRRGEQKWVMEEASGSDHPSRIILSAGLKGITQAPLQARWYPQTLSHDGAKADPCVRGIHVRVLYDAVQNRWEVSQTVWTASLEHPPMPSQFPLDLICHEAPLRESSSAGMVSQDLSSLLETVEGDPGVRWLSPQSVARLFPQAKNSKSILDLGGHRGILLAAWPWYHSLHRSPDTWQRLWNEIQAKLLKRGAQEASGFWVLSVVGLCDPREPKPQVFGEQMSQEMGSSRLFWYDGPIGVLDCKSSGDLGWTAFVPAGGPAALELELPVEICHETASLELGDSSRDDDFWQSLHRVLLARVDAALRSQRSPKAWSPRKELVYQEKSRSNQALEDSDGEGASVGHLWVRLFSYDHDGKKGLMEALILVLLCQVFPEAVPLVMISGTKDKISLPIKKLLENLGAHVVEDRVFASLREQEIWQGQMPSRENTIDLRVFLDIFTPCSGFPWDQTEFIEQWCRYVNRRVPLVPVFPGVLVDTGQK